MSEPLNPNGMPDGPTSLLSDDPRPQTMSRLDERYLDARARQYAEKTMFGGTSLGARVSLFFFLGALAAAAFAVLFLQIDQRIGLAVDDWKQAQRVSRALGAIEGAVNEIRILDRRYAAEPSPATAQALQRSLNTVGLAIEGLGSISGVPEVGDALVTVRDGFSQYGAQMAAYTQKIEEAGYSADTGLNGDRNAAAQDVRAKLKVIGLSLTVPDFDRIHATAPGDMDNAAYASLRERIKGVLADDEAVQGARDEAVKALDRHQAATAKLAQLGAALAERPAAASDIIDYIGPSLRALSDYSAELGRAAPAAFDAERLTARQFIAGGSAAILIVLVIAGIVLMRSMTGPVRRLSLAASRLAEGDRSVSIPARGNTDSIGGIARALDAWLDNLTEIDHLRAEIDDLRLRLVSEAELRTAAERAAALMPSAERPEISGEPLKELKEAEPASAPEPRPEPQVTPPTPQDIPESTFRQLPPLPEPKEEAARGTASPIGSASQELTRFSEFVNEATRDVERTENLMRQLADTGRLIADLEQCVETIRDEAHLLVFRSPGGIGGGPGGGEGAGDDTLVYLSGDGKRGDGDAGAKRFDTIRDAVDRAERLVVSVRRSLDSVTGVAQDIASNASAEALEATNKLLSQSEYLQNMLDDLVHKMKPVSGLGTGAESKDARTRRDGDR